MPEPSQEQPAAPESISWEFPDTPRHQRTPRWYFWAGLTSAGLFIYGLWSGNPLFSLLIVLFALTTYLVQRRPLQLQCTISPDGVNIGQAVYPYRELQRFSIVYQPPEVKNLYFQFRNPLRPPLVIPLQGQNPVAIRHLLMDYLDEDIDRDEEPMLDHLSRMLKL